MGTTHGRQVPNYRTATPAPELIVTFGGASGMSFLLLLGCLHPSSDGLVRGLPLPALAAVELFINAQLGGTYQCVTNCCDLCCIHVWLPLKMVYGPAWHVTLYPNRLSMYVYSDGLSKTRPSTFCVCSSNSNIHKWATCHLAGWS